MNLYEAAACLIENTGWTQEVTCRDSGGYYVPTSSPKASCFCLVGAVMKVCRDKYGDTDEAYEKMEASISSIKEKLGSSPAKWNDNPERTKEEVITLLRSVE